MALRQEEQEHALHSFINSFVYSLNIPVAAHFQALSWAQKPQTQIPPRSWTPTSAEEKL